MIENKYKPVPFWSWNDELEPEKLCEQIEWMHKNGIGGFFMHARGGLTTPYLGEKWFKCVEACLKKAKELNMEAYAYDENGWPSGFAGGKILENEKDRDMFITSKIGPLDPNARVSFDISGERVVRVSEGDNVMNIYLNISASTADILNKEVVRKFIDLTHEEYKKHDIHGNLRGFFTDEPQYFRYGTPYTRVLPQYFLEKYNEDIFDRIVLLFVEKEGYKDFRYKYFKAMQELMLDSFAKQIYEWCDENDYKLTGHYIEEKSLGTQMLCCGGIMPFYEYEHIPGIDYLGRPIVLSNSAKQLGSVMAQLGKKQGLGEIFACTGWDATPLELKNIAEYLMQDGVNLICHHLLPYREHGQRKRDYPEHYSDINPWVIKDFATFNNHLSELGKMLANSKDLVKIGLFCPIRTAYFYFSHEGHWGTDFCCYDLNQKYKNAYLKLTENGIPYHVLDETLMSKYGRVEGNSLIVGNCKYDVVVFPEGTLTMDKETEVLLRKFANNGGKFYLFKDAPSMIGGNEFNHDYISNCLTFDDLKELSDVRMSENPNIKYTYRVDENGNKIIFAVNIGEEIKNVTIEVDGCTTFKYKDSIISNCLSFDKYESKILYPSNEPVEEVKETKVLKLGKTFNVEGSPLNYLTLDTLSYSYDDVIYSNNINCMGAFNVLLNKKYQGDLYLKYNFMIKDIPSHCELLLENTNTIEVLVNGKKVTKKGTVLEENLWLFDIAHCLKDGKNEVKIKIDYYQSEHVYYALFGENVLETLKNCLVYDTTIESIYLRGDFGVYGDFENGQADNVMVGKNFYISKQLKTIDSLIEDGYPFFRGEIVLKQEIEVEDVNQTLVIDDRFQLIDLYVNDEFVKRMMLDYKVDLSNYLKAGKNEITLKLVVSNRNLLGPHHDPREEPFDVGPYTFERFGSWNENGESELCLDRYSFVKTIL